MRADADSNFFLFESAGQDRSRSAPYCFVDPVEVLVLERPEDIRPFFVRLEKLALEYYVAGFFSYELGYLLENKFKRKTKSNFPYAYFCAYKEPVEKKRIVHTFFKSFQHTYRIENLTLNMSRSEYAERIGVIDEHISRGDIYQADFTMKYRFDFSGSAWGLYRDLKDKQPVKNSMFARCGDYTILSHSPELFFEKKGRHLTMRPMKGTMVRGRTGEEDALRQNALSQDEKNRSENLMIVDVLRNDLGRISKFGSVRVTRRFDVERYKTLFQMTSMIESTIDENSTVYDYIKALFPSGSVTGAPKIRSMEILRELEKEDRHIYTGAIGFFKPGGDALFNVAIRTVLIKGNKGEMGIGSGIVSDSRCDEEFRECMLKARFLVQKPALPFQLIETMYFKEQYRHCELHMDRMERSAKYFGFVFNRGKAMAELFACTRHMATGAYKVRVLLDRSGAVSIGHSLLDAPPEVITVTVSTHRTNSSDETFFHKTTNRGLYTSELINARNKGFFDVLFFNEKGELTEGAITNVFVEKNGIIFTPPVTCGLLGGVMRHVIMGRYHVREKVLKPEDLSSADELYVTNAIIGFRKVSQKSPAIL